MDTFNNNSKPREQQPVVISSETPQAQEHRIPRKKIKVGVVVVVILLAIILTIGIIIIGGPSGALVEKNQSTTREIVPLTPEMELDRDLDGVLDEDENRLGTSNSEFDTDGDGLSDQTEIELGTDPTNVDTDGDGFLDGIEVLRGYNPNGPGNLPTN